MLTFIASVLFRLEVNATAIERDHAKVARVRLGLKLPDSPALGGVRPCIELLHGHVRPAAVINRECEPLRLAPRCYDGDDDLVVHVVLVGAKVVTYSLVGVKHYSLSAAIASL